MLAVKTRHVKVEAVNDSKEVVAVVYIVTACSIAIIVLSNVLQDFTNISEGLYLTATLVGTTSTVTLMFIPKVSHVTALMCILRVNRCGHCGRTPRERMCLKYNLQAVSFKLSYTDKIHNRL